MLIHLALLGIRVDTGLRERYSDPTIDAIVFARPRQWNHATFDNTSVFSCQAEPLIGYGSHQRYCRQATTRLYTCRGQWTVLCWTSTLWRESLVDVAGTMALTEAEFFRCRVEHFKSPLRRCLFKLRYTYSNIVQGVVHDWASGHVHGEALPTTLLNNPEQFLLPFQCLNLGIL